VNNNFFSKLKSKKLVILKCFLIVIAIFLIILIACGVALFLVNKYIFEASDSDNTESQKDDCNVYGINLHGDLYTYISPEYYNDKNYLIADLSSSEEIQAYIQKAEEDPKIKAIILEIDSYGGYPVAGEEVANALKLASKPTIAFIRSAGVSAAYWAATGADIIFASKNSDVGSIGVTMSYVDNVENNLKEGYNFNKISTGKFKDAGDPNKVLTPEEKNIFERDLQIILNNFISDIAENRKLSIDKVRQLADGSSVLGESALKNGLIDRIGDINTVKEYLKEELKTDIEICW